MDRFRALTADPKDMALEARAAHAGMALACPFSSSAEYEAAIISAKRAAGVYGPKRHRRHMMVAGAIAAVLALAATAL